MTTYWVPAVEGEDFTYIEREVPELEHVWIDCRACGAQLQQFSAPPGRGVIGVQMFFKVGVYTAQIFKVLPNGMPQWHLFCPNEKCPHQVQRLTADKVARVFAAANNGTLPTRRMPM